MICQPEAGQASYWRRPLLNRHDAQARVCASKNVTLISFRCPYHTLQPEGLSPRKRLTQKIQRAQAEHSELPQGVLPCHLGRNRTGICYLRRYWSDGYHVSNSGILMRNGPYLKFASSCGFPGSGVWVYPRLVTMAAQAHNLKAAKSHRKQRQQELLVKGVN
jgi:hypothetical protein